MVITCCTRDYDNDRPSSLEAPSRSDLEKRIIALETMVKNLESEIARLKDNESILVYKNGGYRKMDQSYDSEFYRELECKLFSSGGKEQ